MYLLLGLLVVLLIVSKFVIRSKFEQDVLSNRILKSTNDEITYLLNENGFKMVSHSKFKINLSNYFQINSDYFYINNPLFLALKDDKRYISINDKVLKDDNLVDFIKIALLEYSSIESMGIAGKVGLTLYNLKPLFYLIASYLFIANVKMSTTLIVAIIPLAIKFLFGVITMKDNSNKLFNKNNGNIYIAFRIIDLFLCCLICVLLYKFSTNFLSQLIVMVMLISSIRELGLKIFNIKHVGLTYIYTLF